MPTTMPTLAVAVDLITLTMYTAVEVRHLCSAVAVAIVLEYTTADQEMKLEWSAVSVWFLCVYMYDRLHY